MTPPIRRTTNTSRTIPIPNAGTTDAATRPTIRRAANKSRTTPTPNAGTINAAMRTGEMHTVNPSGWLMVFSYMSLRIPVFDMSFC